MMKNIEAFYERVVVIFGIIAGVSLLVMTVTITWSVTARYFLDRPPIWSFALNTDLLVFVTYIGAAYTFMKGGHVKVDIIYSHLSDRRKQFMDLIACVAALIFVSILVWQGWLQAWGNIDNRMLDTMVMPPFCSQVLVPLGCALCVPVIIIKIVKTILSLGRAEESE